MASQISAALLLFYFLNPKQKIKGHAQKHEDIPQAVSAYRDKRYLWFIGLVSLFAFCFFQLFTTIPKYFRDNLFLSEQYIGFIMALNGLLIVAFEMVMIHYLETKNKYTFYIPIGVALCGLSYFSLLLPGNARVVTLIMIVLVTIGEIGCMPFMNTFWTMRSNDKNRGQYAALYTMAWGIAQTLGPFLCARLVDASSFGLMFIVMGSISLVVAAGFYRLHRLG